MASAFARHVIQHWTKFSVPVIGVVSAKQFDCRFISQEVIDVLGEHPVPHRTPAFLSLLFRPQSNFAESSALDLSRDISESGTAENTL